MAKKLDNLLEGIEGKGGFRDASITSQTNSVIALEEGIWALSDRCRIWRVCSPSMYIFLITEYLLVEFCFGNVSSCFSIQPQCC